MDPQLVAALITAVLGIVAAVVGYLFREYRNRAKPFMSVQEVRGDASLSHLAVDIPDLTREKISKSFYIRVLDTKDKLSEVQIAYRNILTVKARAPEFIELIERIISACAVNDSLNTSNLLFKALVNKIWNSWLVEIVERGRVTPPEGDKSLPVQILSYESPDEEGSYWIAFPSYAVPFGSSLSRKPILQKRCAEFVSLIERLDMTRLKAFFEQVRLEIVTLLEVANTVEESINALLWNNAHWKVDVYIANLGKNPFLIDPTGHLNIYDDSGAKHNESCYVVLTHKRPDGTVTYERVTSPTIIGPESYRELSFVTNKPQQSMERGKAIRDAFNRHKAKCQVSFQIQKPGMARTKTLMTPLTEFVQLAEDEQ